MLLFSDSIWVISNPQQGHIILFMSLGKPIAGEEQGHFTGSFSLSPRRELAHSIRPSCRGLCYCALVLSLTFLLQAHHPDSGQVLGPQSAGLLLVTQE